MSALQHAINRFNTALGYQVVLPIEARFLVSLADIASIRGRPELAQALLDAVSKANARCLIPEHQEVEI